MVIQTSPINILQISDLHIMPEFGEKLLGVDTEYYFHLVLEQALQSPQPIDLILITGDLAQHPCRSSYQRIREKLQKIPIPCICLPGNHDDFSLMQDCLNSGNVSCKPQTIIDNWQIICLNSQVPGKDSGFIEDSEISFLKSCLDSNPELYTMIAIHHHCLPINSAWMDTMKIENGEVLLQISQQYPKIKLLIHGHIHQILDLKIEQLKIYGSPSTCFQFKPQTHDFELDSSEPGYRTIKLLANGQLTSEVHRITEQLQDLQLTSHGY